MTPYKQKLFGGLPLLTTRIVRDPDFPDFGDREQISCPQDAALGLLQQYYRDKDREEFIVLLLDAANTVTGLSRLSVGGLAASIVEPRAVFRAAILANAASVVCAHNHPSGNPEPSREDLRITRQLVEAGKLLGIPVLDHIIVAERSYTSLAERGLI